MDGVFFIRGGLFVEGKVEVWPGLHQVSSAPGPAHLSPKATVRVLLELFSLTFSLTSGAPHVEGHTGSSATWVFLLFMLHGFHGQSSLLRCCKVSVLDTIPPWVMALLNAKQGGGFVFCLMPRHEEDVLGSSPVFPASLSPFFRLYFLLEET